MTLHDRLLAETAPARAEFMAIPLIGRALAGDVPRATYVAFLTQAYHHVRHTCPLLSLAAARTDDPAYQAALDTYLAEERGHDDWILEDIAAMGGDAEAARRGPARPPCRAMVGYAYHAIERISPYALLGMVHVLEGMSARLAGAAARALRQALAPGDGGGFRYLASHGALDVEHTAFFAALVNRLDPARAGDVVIDGATVMYWLYGSIFRDLERLDGETAHAA